MFATWGGRNQLWFHHIWSRLASKRTLRAWVQNCALPAKVRLREAAEIPQLEGVESHWHSAIPSVAWAWYDGFYGCLGSSMLRFATASLAIAWIWSLQGCDSHVPVCAEVSPGGVFDEPSCQQACRVNEWAKERGNSSMREWLGSPGVGKCRCTLYLGHNFSAPTEGFDLCKDAGYKKPTSEE